ncbi:MAG TPA: hypothetical protein VF506_17980 [Streptosporangiaceae bacterium]
MSEPTELQAAAANNDVWAKGHEHGVRFEQARCAEELRKLADDADDQLPADSTLADDMRRLADYWSAGAEGSRP